MPRRQTYDRQQSAHRFAFGRDANGGYRWLLRMRCRKLTVGKPPLTLVMATQTWSALS